ncbi:MAG: hypothetical protein AAFR93_11075 [Pseudomonadota bacterium]
MIEIKGKKNRAVLAILASADGLRRGRTFLKSLVWAKSYDEGHAQNSLRQCLSLLRRALGPHAEHLKSDRSTVWLEDVQLAPSNRTSVFFEDAPDGLGELFAQWLASCRGSWAGHQAATASPVSLPPSAPQVPSVAIGQPVVLADNLDSEMMAMVLLDSVAYGLRQQGLVDVFDLRDLNGDEAECDWANPRLMLMLRLMQRGAMVRLTLSVQDFTTRKVVWSSSTTTDTNTAFAQSPDMMLEFANQAVDAITSAVLSEDGPCQSEQSALFKAIHHIMSVSLPKQRAARQFLAQTIPTDASAIAHAWHGFSFAYEVGEAGQGSAAEVCDMAAAHIAKALEQDPGNPIVLALAGHVHGYVLGDLERGAELSSLARKQGDQFPIVWDLSAMNALYCDDVERAYLFARRAQSLGRFSPYKPLFDSSAAIAASARGKHLDAVRLSKRVLEKQPGFLGLMRHLVASYSALDLPELARAAAREVRQRDKSFQAKSVLNDAYPLPSPTSRRLVSEALARLDQTQ